MLDDATRRLRDLPRVDTLAAMLTPALPAPVATAVAREVIAKARAALRHVADAGQAGPSPQADVAAEALALARRLGEPSLVPVLNGTGVVLHTNLGRAPLPELPAAGRGYSNLELDLTTGQRGSRMAHVIDLLRFLTGAEDAVVVNNAAAALMLAVATTAGGREVVVARGELVEIGDSFRLPDILEASGVRLREVGTTNRVGVDDYARTAGPAVGAVLRVYPSNFAIVGFTASPPPEMLAATARAMGVPLIVDVGSDPLTPLALPPGHDAKPSTRTLVAGGADLVLFSGDKEAGGPQAGIIVGRQALVTKIRRHPWMRAMRLDKLRVASLEALLRAHLLGSAETIPTHRMIATPTESLKLRAVALASRLGPRVEAVPTDDTIGGGAHPLLTLPGWGIAIAGDEPQATAARLRSGSPALLARIDAHRVIIALRTIEPDDDATVLRGVEMVLDSSPARG